MDDDIIMDDNRDSVRPFFLPSDLKWDELPEAARAVIHDIVSPLYRAYVFANADPLQRAAGMSLVYLTTLEVIECVGKGASMLEGPSSDDEVRARQDQIDRYLRLVGAKTKCTDLLLRLQACAKKPSSVLSVPPLSWNRELENRSFVDQKLQAFLQRHATQFAAQGTVVASWRNYRGRRLGPYFRLAWRGDDGQQHSRYLGMDRALAAEIEAWLSALRGPSQATRRLKEARQSLSRALRQERSLLRRELAKSGLSLRGAEVRGWRHARLPVVVEDAGPCA